MIYYCLIKKAKTSETLDFNPIKIQEQLYRKIITRTGMVKFQLWSDTQVIPH